MRLDYDKTYYLFLSLYINVILELSQSLPHYFVSNTKKRLSFHFIPLLFHFIPLSSSLPFIITIPFVFIFLLPKAKIQRTTSCAICCHSISVTPVAIKLLGF